MWSTQAVSFWSVGIAELTLVKCLELDLAQSRCCFFDSGLERTRVGLNSVAQTFSPFLITVSTSDKLCPSQETTIALLSYGYQPGFLAFLVGQSLSRV